MEAKKNPNKDLHRQSTKFFLIGLSISITLAITAFEWTSVKRKLPIPSSDPIMEASIDVVPVVYSVQPPTYVIKSEPKKSNPVSFTTDPITEESPEQESIDISVTGFPNEEVSLPVESIEEVHLFPEVKPMPAGGYESFYNQLLKNLKYPRQAQRNRTTGKVFIEFVVDKTGTVTNLKILKGIGSGCDEEAIRVLTQTRWEPGRQRGRPVNVRMALPISFKLE